MAKKRRSRRRTTTRRTIKRNLTISKQSLFYGDDLPRRRLLRLHRSDYWNKVAKLKKVQELNTKLKTMKQRRLHKRDWYDYYRLLLTARSRFRKPARFSHTYRKAVRWKNKIPDQMLLNKLYICTRRAIRKQVLLALGHGGRGNRKPEWKDHSHIKC